MKMTKYQALATELEGHSLLVSAAAGSGKTSVLTERVIRKLTDPVSGSDANKLMILTYTNAAAAEMRSRITSRLREIAASEPDNTFVRRQLMLLPAAKICTIHSACLDIIRSNFQLCNLDPNFTIAEENKLVLMKNEELEDFAEYIYQMAEKDENVSEVVEYFTKGRNDGLMTRTIDSVSDFLAKQPYEKQYIDYAFSITPEQSLDMCIQYVKTEFEDIVRRYDQLIQQAVSVPKLLDFYSTERDFVAHLTKYIKEDDFDSVYQLLKDKKLKSHPSKTKNDDPDFWELVKSTRANLKNRINKIKEEFIYTDKKTVLADRKQELKIFKTFMELCSLFNKRLFEKRKKQRILSFDDVEKYALFLLIADYSDGKLVKTELAKELSENIDEIIVDEFQDCNKTQDLIFSALSKDGSNIFMVGDVKQSIYRFRNAEPRIFLEKQKSSVCMTENIPLTKPSRVDLSTNFRSDKKVIDFVNNVFDTLMTKTCGGIDYTDGHRLEVNENATPHNLSEVEIHLLASATNDDSSASELSKTEAEAEFVASKIQDILQNGQIFDVKAQITRKVKPSDIAILMRAPKTIGMPFENALKAREIPFINNNPSGNYLESPEIRSVISYLQAIDNPYDDVPLVTLMYSDFFCFTANELGAIRASNKKSLFYDAVKNYAKTDAKTDSFVKTLESLRTLAQTTDVYGIISAIYEKTGILLRLSLKPGGQEAKANLTLLLDYAADFESVRYRGLFAFISYIIKLSENNEKNSVPAARLKKAGDCVNILSVHRSKGLEYPIVFFVGTGNTIKSSTSTDIMADSDIGVGGYIRDSVRHRDFSSLTRNLVRVSNKTEDINEYIRLLYVALTRPVSYVYITASMGVKEIETAMINAYAVKGKPEKSDLTLKQNFFNWLMFPIITFKPASKFCAFAGVPTDLCIKDASFDMFVHDVTALERKEDKEKDADNQVSFDKQTAKELILREYDYLQDTLLPAKLSVSEIKKIKSSETEKDYTKTSFKKRGFSELKEGIEKGNATHSFLQFCDFDAITDEISFEKEKERLVNEGFISKKDADLASGDKILGFLSSDIMKELMKNSNCYKEQRFLFALSASEILDTDSNEKIMIQGIIDCYFEKDNEAVIVDYKTDNVKDEKTLIDRYSSQLDMYEVALNRIKGVKVSDKYIYSFCLERFIKV